MFLNNSEFEIISIRKIIGSVSGGIIITKNLNFYKKAKKEQVNNKSIGIYQSRLKFREVNKNKTFQNWLYQESTNTFVEYNSLLNIKRNLKNFEINPKKNYIKKNKIS